MVLGIRAWRVGASKMANPESFRLKCCISYFVLALATSVQSEILECPSSCSCLGQFVDCSKQGFVKVPKDIPIWAENLELSDNAISTLLEEKLQHLTKLKQLKLSKNLLTEMPMLSGMTNLAYLSLAHNNIHSVNHQALKDLHSLKTLDLNNNHLYEITEHNFPNDSSIQNLNLNSNRIRTIEKGSLDSLSNLIELKLSRNHLSRFSKELFKHLKNVKVLDLNRNRFTEIEGLSFFGLDDLNVLKLRRNSIVTLLDGAFWGLQTMTILQLDHNNISTVTKNWLYGLVSLRQLTLNNNLIKTIEKDGWEFCQQLVDLDLSNNKLYSIDKTTFEHLPKLQRLRLDNNNIAFIADGAFNCTPSLEILELNGNRISWTIEDMTGAFLGLSRLIEFGLASNDIKSINKKAFIGLERLKQMDLRNNSITSIQENAFAAMLHLDKILMNTTSLLCDCNVKWLPVWLEKASFYLTIHAVCAYPYWLKGKTISQVPPGNLTCDDFPIPQIVEDPKTQIALKGENVTLQCKATSSTEVPMTFIWKKDNLDLTNPNVEHFERSPGGKGAEQSSQLSLVNVTYSDEGKYQCVVTNSFGTSYSQKSRISVLIFPTFYKMPGNVTVKSGSIARLECAAQGQPTPQIAWQKDGGNDFPAARQRRMHIMPTDDVFFIINVGTSDMGVYSCTAQNLAGVIVANASLIVIEPPSFVKAMENKEINAGEPIVLECMASGSPKPRLTWTKDGGSLLTTERHFFTADDQLLIIVDTAISDGGTYECIMTNPLGTERGSSHLSVVPASGSGVSETDMTGIIIITVVCCAVGTSIVWVVIIYQTRKRMAPKLPSQDPDSTPHLFLDNNSEHSSSKDSGTGDSAKQSSDHLLVANGLAINIAGGSNESLHTVNESTKSLESGEGVENHRTDHDRCCDCVGQLWSAQRYPGVKTCSYHSLQATTDMH